MSLKTPLPPPIRDPSGKIYIAIPAPPFVIAQDASVPSGNLNSAPGYIYIEYSSDGPHELPRDLISLDRNELVESNQSANIHNWMVMNCSTEPPPDHVPWAGHVLLSSSSGTLSSLMNEPPGTSDRIVNSGSSTIESSSASTLDFPSTDSGNTLLNGSLPSACSSAWSGGIVAPPIPKPKAVSNVPKTTSIPAPRTRKSDSLVNSHNGNDGRRYTVCATPTTKRREAQIFNRRRTMVKTQPAQSPPPEAKIPVSKARIMSQIDDLDGFFSEGLKKMDLTMQCFRNEQNKIATPSLVVSTSSAINPVSIDSFDDLKLSSPSLAERRGKVAPGTLKLNDCSGLASSTIDYPDVPTAFRVSPEPTLDAFPESPIYPELKLDPKLTTDQMITSLREQVEDFYPKNRESGRISNAFDTQCDDAWKWLEDELEFCPNKEKSPSGASHLNRPLKGKHLAIPESVSDNSISSIPGMFPLPPTEVEKSDCAKLPQNTYPTFRERAISFHASVLRLSTSSSRNLSSQTQTPKLKPRKSILSTVSTSSSGSAKKVRFSDTPPSVIPPPQNILKADEAAASPTKRLLVSPKRKPVPDFNPPTPTTMRFSAPLTPVKSSVVRKSSPLNPGAQSRMTMPSTRFASKRGEGNFSGSLIPVAATPPPKKGPLVFNSGNTPTSREKVDKRDLAKKSSRPMSLGANLKENLDRSFSDKLASLAKRRSYAVGGSSADKENLRASKVAELIPPELQKKGAKRGSPFQSVLSRLRG